MGIPSNVFFVLKYFKSIPRGKHKFININFNGVKKCSVIFRTIQNFGGVILTGQTCSMNKRKKMLQ